ncbi:putative transcription factor MYB-HB-like family [Dioscorea sansibarensis]
MGSPQSELTLDFKPTDKSLRLEEFLARLEEERLKIEAFKRELPLCMKLLTMVPMETYKQQLETYQTSNGAKPVLEEYIPLKSMPIHGDQEKPVSTVSSEKASWMVSAQLWSPAGDETKQQQAPAETPPKNSIVIPNTEVSTNLALDNNTKQRHGTGAFIPFTKDNNLKVTSSCITTSATTTITTCNSSSYVLPDLALAFHNKEIQNKNLSEVESGSKSTTPPTNGQNSGTSSQTHRKARRCWSPDLHRRFVNALQILGGSQVATPKQIRELMKVDGLTNDEVKSHLQKYRLHTRRPMVAAQPAAAAAPPQLVVLGGIWVPPEYATTAAAGPGIYGAHPVPTHYCAPPVAQEFYSPATAAAVAAVQHHHHHHQQRHQHVQQLPPRNVGSSYKGRVAESPESDMRSGGERSDSIGEGGEEEEERQEREDEDEEGDADVEVDDKSAAENALVLVNHGLQETSGLKL